MATVSQRPKTAILASNGVCIGSTCESMELMRPISVRSPLATTMPVPWP